MKISRHLAWLALLLSVVVTACSATPPKELLERNDHSGLTTWYEQEAARLQEKAEAMRQRAERYAAFSEPHLTPKETREDLIAHCRSFMHYYAKAAEEAETLAKLHREQETAIP